nr:hypothetical protein JVH1_0948 [Rhodococcus sp. JVH1]
MVVENVTFSESPSGDDRIGFSGTLESKFLTTSLPQQLRAQTS